MNRKGKCWRKRELDRCVEERKSVREKGVKRREKCKEKQGKGEQI